MSGNIGNKYNRLKLAAEKLLGEASKSEGTTDRESESFITLDSRKDVEEVNEEWKPAAILINAIFDLKELNVGQIAGGELPEKIKAVRDALKNYKDKAKGNKKMLALIEDVEVALSNYSNTKTFANKVAREAGVFGGEVADTFNRGLKGAAAGVESVRNGVTKPLYNETKKMVKGKNERLRGQTSIGTALTKEFNRKANWANSSGEGGLARKASFTTDYKGNDRDQAKTVSEYLRNTVKDLHETGNIGSFKSWRQAIGATAAATYGLTSLIAISLYSLAKVGVGMANERYSLVNQVKLGVTGSTLGRLEGKSANAGFAIENKGPNNSSVEINHATSGARAIVEYNEQTKSNVITLVAKDEAGAKAMLKFLEKAAKAADSGPLVLTNPSPEALDVLLPKKQTKAAVMGESDTEFNNDGYTPSNFMASRRIVEKEPAEFNHYAYDTKSNTIEAEVGGVKVKIQPDKTMVDALKDRLSPDDLTKVALIDPPEPAAKKQGRTLS